jgi:peptidyl-prolyl cis-trans isomerase C
MNRNLSLAHSFRHSVGAWPLLATLMFSGRGMAQTEPLRQPSTEVLQALSKPFVVVNEQAQPTAHAEVLYREGIARGATSSPELRDEVRQNLINHALIVQAARADGLDRQPLVQAQMDLASQAALVKLWQQKYLADHPITEVALQLEYKQQIAQMGSDELLIRHIVVADEALARRLILSIQQGAAFADLAAEHSTDSDSKRQGGLVDWVSQDQLIPEVAQVVRQMKPSQLWAEPIRSNQGWHVVRLQERRPLRVPDLGKLRPQLLELLAQKAIDEKLQSLRQKAVIR